MKIRTLKKILKDYKPIIEVRVPTIITQYDLSKLVSEMRNLIGDKYLIFIMRIPESPIRLSKKIDKEKLEQFRKEWFEFLNSQSPMPIYSAEEETMEISEFTFISIHSPLKLPLSLYKKKLEKLQEIVKQKLSENNY